MHNGPFLSDLFTNLWRYLTGFHASDAGSAATSITHTPPHFTGPAVNVDGTPMLNDVVDVMGKVYGDSGSTFGSDFGMSDSGLHGSDW